MDDLIVFRKTYEYLLWLRPSVLRFVRVYRFSLGVEVEESGLRLLRAIICANYENDKKPRIAQAIIELEIQRVYIRLAYEYRCLSDKQFAYANGLLAEIMRLLRGWQKSA
jgi:hypothetical protein